MFRFISDWPQRRLPQPLPTHTCSPCMLLQQQPPTHMQSNRVTQLVWFLLPKTRLRPRFQPLRDRLETHSLMLTGNTQPYRLPGYTLHQLVHLDSLLLLMPLQVSRLMSMLLMPAYNGFQMIWHFFIRESFVMILQFDFYLFADSIWIPLYYTSEIICTFQLKSNQNLT